MIRFFPSLIKKLFRQKSTVDKKFSADQKKDQHNASGSASNCHVADLNLSEICQDSQKILQGKKNRNSTGKDSYTKKYQRRKWELESFNVPVMDGMKRFHDFDLPLNLMHAIADLKFNYCMPVQQQVLPYTLKGQDATAMAQTGTGKSAAFLVTIIAKLLNRPIRGGRIKGMPRAIILAPTRELVIQIEKDAKALAKYTNLNIIAVFGGMGYKKQQEMLRKKPVDIIAATPGRLIDFTRQRLIKPGKVEILVLDEADRMLDMGFIPDVRKIIYSTPRKESRQTLFFSATLSPDILALASQWTKNALKVEIDPDHAAAESVHQKIYIVTEKEKSIVLYNLISGKKLDRVLIFVNRRDSTKKLALFLAQYGFKTAVLSGSVSQKDRLKALDDFRKGKIKIMVATDVAARGLHIKGISHVINYDLPEEAEHYIHRIGRTGRAGAEGISVSFADEMSSFHIPDIEKVLGNKLECEYPEENMLLPLPEPLKKNISTTIKPTPKFKRNSKNRGKYKTRKKKFPRHSNTSL